MQTHSAEMRGTTRSQEKAKDDMQSPRLRSERPQVCDADEVDATTNKGFDSLAYERADDNFHDKKHGLAQYRKA
jgi:hypothetical protein